MKFNVGDLVRVKQISVAFFNIWMVNNQSDLTHKEEAMKSQQLCVDRIFPILSIQDNYDSARHCGEYWINPEDSGYGWFREEDLELVFTQ